MPWSVAFSCIIAIFCLGVVDASEWQSRIVGGTNATGNVCPHTVAIRLVGRNFLCNGVLISNQDVLTPAHCVYNGNVVRNASDFLVVLGSLNNTNSSATMVRGVAAVWPHSQFTPSTRLSDVAVLRLSAAVQNSTSLVPIQLATANAAVNRTCTICGWGANTTNGQPLAILQRLSVQIQPSNATFCTRVNGNVALRADLICAGDLAAGKGACTGDEGAPLVCDSRLHGVLTAVTTGSCGGLNDTSIFIDTVYHRSWIVNRTQTQVVPPGGGTGGGSGGGAGGGGGGGGGGASHAIMQIWVVMMPILVLIVLK